MLPGLQQGQEKMSKSDPSSSIFMEDEEVCIHNGKEVISNFFVLKICNLTTSSQDLFEMVDTSW